VNPVRSRTVARPAFFPIRVPHRALGFVGLTAAWWWVTAAPVVAQDESYDGRSTDDTVRLVVGGLVAIAVGTAVLTLVYLWHTSPRRRHRVAARRAQSEDATTGATGPEE